MIKLFINYKPENIAYGGGNVFSLNFINYINSKGINVVFELEEDTDIYFMIDPFKGRGQSYRFKKYGLDDIVKFKKMNGGKIFIRVNDCDKTRPNVKPEASRECKIFEHRKHISYFVFNSDFIRKHYHDNHEELKSIPHTVIYNGGNEEHFYPDLEYKPKKKLKIVTHHFSTNMFKGYDIYYKLHKFYENRTDYEFVFIGRAFNTEKPEYADVPIVGPYSGKELGDCLRECDIYVTASKYDSGPMHVVEGVLAGLPMLYIDCDGGGRDLCELPKEKIGEKFSTFYELVDKIEIIRDYYETYRNNVIKNKEIYYNSKCMEDYYQAIINNCK